MLRAEYRRIILRFKETAVTSRDRMQQKETYVVKVWHSQSPDKIGVGECPIFRGLSAEDTPDYERMLAEACEFPNRLPEISSIRFGFESAILDLQNGGCQRLADTPFVKGERTIRINGLVWMGDKKTMLRRIGEKLDGGFRCVKLKIGGIDFDDELDLLGHIRSEYTASDIELRVDANGAFAPSEAYERLQRLSEYDLHSIEQPIRAGQWSDMASLCERSPIPVALDEDLIGFRTDRDKNDMLSEIKPAYIILKPALCGGFSEADRWIATAQQHGIGWWATSALESNIGLNAIAQWVSRHDIMIPQGLGTGGLYMENFPSPISLSGEQLRCISGAVSSSGLWEIADKMSKSCDLVD